MIQMPMKNWKQLINEAYKRRTIVETKPEVKEKKEENPKPVDKKEEVKYDENFFIKKKLF